MIGNAELCDYSALRKQSSSGMKVRDMVRKYDTAVKSDLVKASYSSIGSSKSSYCGLNAIPDDDFEGLYGEAVGHTLGQGQGSPTSPSRSSSGSQKTVRRPRSPGFQAFDANHQAIPPLDNQKSFLNLSRSQERPRPAPREKRARHSSVELEAHQYTDDNKMNISDASYQSKTIISKTPNGVRIIVDIFFDQNKGIALEDVVGSRIETDIPPSKILKEFQKRVAEFAQD